MHNCVYNKETFDKCYGTYRSALTGEIVVYQRRYYCPMQNTSLFIAAHTYMLSKPLTKQPKKGTKCKLKLPLQTKKREKNMGFHQNMKLG